MGQYYKIVNVDKKEYFSPWDFHCGAKLLEWNYVGDDMVGNPVTNTLHYLLEDRWKGDRVYVVGDYANVFDKRESNFFCKKAACTQEKNAEHNYKKLFHTGKYIVNTVPLPTVLSTDTFPPWVIATCFTMERPRPVPPRLRLTSLFTL